MNLRNCSKCNRRHLNWDARCRSWLCLSTDCNHSEAPSLAFPDPDPAPHEAKIARLESVNAELLSALRFYVQTCGNTAASVTRETAGEMYAVGMKAIERAAQP